MCIGIVSISVIRVGLRSRKYDWASKLVLLVEIGFFHGIMRKALWESMPGRVRRSGRMY